MQENIPTVRVYQQERRRGARQPAVPYEVTYADGRVRVKLLSPAGAEQFAERNGAVVKRAKP